VDKRAVIPDYRKVRASGNFFGMLVFLNFKGRDADNVIALQRQLNGLVEINRARRRWACLLRQGTRQSQE
jgi:hypothetical protein